MKLKAQAKKYTYLVHRWLGIAGCVLMVLWFVSGVVMLFTGYPKLTPWERLAPLPVLSATECCRSPDALPKGTSPADAELVLTSIGGRPSYVMRDGKDGLRVQPATDEDVRQPASPESALAAAHAFAPGAPAHYAGTVDEDRWTHSRALNPHRPLHRVELEGETPGTLYISSATGEVVLDAPRYQQYWNYVGAWLHWLYMFRNQPSDPVWSWVVIILSTACTVVAVTGVFVGIWRWRFRGRYRSGSRSPYQEGWMRWHHITGLVFSIFVCTWIFSGLMSMSPYGLFPDAQEEPNEAAYQGKAGTVPDTLKRPAQIIQALQQADFRPVELQWHRLGGEEYVLAHDAQAHTRLVRAGADGQLRVQETWKPDEIMPAARRLFAQATHSSEVLTTHDAYYYQRHPEAMNGASIQGLPALRLDYENAERTRVYIDLHTGEVVNSLPESYRVRRWLFYFLHSWDVPAMLQAGTGRDAVLILLSVGGLAVSLTGVVIGWRRLKLKVARG